MSYFDDNEERIIHGRGAYAHAPLRQRTGNKTMGRGKRAKDEPGFEVGEVMVARASDKAVLCVMPDNDQDWIPFSQIHGDSEINADNCAEDAEGTLVITKWLAEQKNLVECLQI